MSFTDQKPFIADAGHLALNWGGAAKGERFRCGLCGHKFVAGDTVRWLFTNNIPNASGNPFVCANCDGPDVIEKWKAHASDWKQGQDKFWHFRTKE